MLHRPLAGKVAIVTGAGSPIGLGRAMTLGLVQAGARVAMLDVNEDWLEQTANDVREIGGDNCVITRVCDVSDAESAEEAVHKTIAGLGGLHILVNNAGINRQGPIDTVSEEDWDDIMAVNLKGPFLISQEILPIMVGIGGGRIINIASVSGLYGGPTTAHYAASKAGLISLTQVLARWGADHNIFVNSISPGIIETDLTREELRGGGGKNVVGLTLLKRPGQVEDVASIAVMLASDEQNYMTGQTISPNGGSYFTD